MKGVGFWFTPSVPGKEKTAPQRNSRSFSKYYPLFSCHRCSASCPSTAWLSPHTTSCLFHHISHYQLLGWACPKSHLSLLLSLVEMLPSFGNCLILISIASLKAPGVIPQPPQGSIILLGNQPPFAEGKPVTHPRRTGISPHPTPPLHCLISPLFS